MNDNKTINLSLPKSLLDAIDKQAQTEYRNRSDLIREAAREYITRRGGMSTLDKVTSQELERVKKALDFGDFSDDSVIIISCIFRPQPNSVKDIFESNSSVVELLEKPPKLRSMGWDLQTLDRARPVAGEYLELANGKRKLLRLYRDGQFIFAGDLGFFGHAVNRSKEAGPAFNLLSVAEFILNFVNFTDSLAESLDINPNLKVYSIAVSNPSSKERGYINLQAYDGFGTEKVGELPLDWAEREITVKSDDHFSPERIAYMIYSEFSYFFGIRGDELWYVNKDKREIDKKNFLKD